MPPPTELSLPVVWTSDRKNTFAAALRFDDESSHDRDGISEWRPHFEPPFSRQPIELEFGDAKAA
jgi:hypothetical protein